MQTDLHVLMETSKRFYVSLIRASAVSEIKISYFIFNIFKFEVNELDVYFSTYNPFTRSHKYTILTQTPFLTVYI